jgi:hypothetical protein
MGFGLSEKDVSHPLSGPRVFGLIRPGISFAISELIKKPSHKRGGDPLPETIPNLAKLGAAFEASGLSCRMILIFASLAVPAAISLAFLA